MSAEIASVENGTMTVRVSARLTQSELAAIQKETGAIIERLGRVRILVLAEHFQGWEEGGQWNDFSFQEAHDQHIERMAIVGDEKWQDLALLFASQGLRPFPIEFFPPGRLAEARKWLHQ
jgi:hypothetical protein